MEKIFKQNRFLTLTIIMVGFMSSILLYISCLSIMAHEIWHFFHHLPTTPKDGQHLAISFLEVLDTLLIALTLQIVGVALYEFFICRDGKHSEFLEKLHIRSFHDLKVILLQVSALILAIMFVERAVAMSSALDVMYFAMGVACVMIAIAVLIKVMSHD